MLWVFFLKSSCPTKINVGTPLRSGYRERAEAYSSCVTLSGLVPFGMMVIAPE